VYAQQSGPPLWAAVTRFAAVAAVACVCYVADACVCYEVNFFPSCRSSYIGMQGVGDMRLNAADGGLRERCTFARQPLMYVCVCLLHAG
jgi:hypothetical protein